MIPQLIVVQKCMNSDIYDSLKCEDNSILGRYNFISIIHSAAPII